MLRIDIKMERDGTTAVRKLELGGATETIGAEFCHIFHMLYNAARMENPEAGESLRSVIQLAACDASPAWKQTGLPAGVVWSALSEPVEEETV